jgi:AGZA family xanthine/uracil permease-like MFS transporter
MHLGKIEGTQALGLAGLMIMAFLEARRKKGSLLAGIILIAALSMILGYSKPPSQWLSVPPSINIITGELQLMSPMRLTTILVILTFLYIALFDGLGTLLAVSEAAGLSREAGYEKRLSRMLTADSAANMIGAWLGTSTVTAYIESNTGISQGGRTGWTAFFSAILFFLSIFFVPLIASIPSFATAPALIMVGVFMIREITRISFDHWDESLPAFLTMILMPFTTSIATGLMFGFISYTALKILLRKWADLNVVLICITVFSVFNLIVGGRFV